MVAAVNFCPSTPQVPEWAPWTLPQMTTGVKGADALLSVVGTLVEANKELHALLAIVLRENRVPPPGSGAAPAPSLEHLSLYWAAAPHHGGKWSSPPLGSAQYPPRHVTEIVGSCAWRTPFALHSSPDGRPTHVCMIQVTLEGVLK